jgi:heme A synthase
MQPELALKAISHTTIAIFLLTLLVLLLISLRKELSGEPPLRGIVYLGLGVISLCAFIALMTALYRAQQMILPHSHSHRFDTGYNHSCKPCGNFFHTDNRPNCLT